ncbi:MAG: hypothetical protein EXR62_08030 [Chloroflexi bacterium]|nr:hypothetical protein [Chloroflexota bacterium]
MARKQNAQARLQRLQEMGTAVAAQQVATACEILENEKNTQVVLAALEILAAYPAAAARPVLLRRYAYYHEDGVRRDPGTYIRTAIVNVLRQVAQPEDVPLLEGAVTTYEFLPPGRSEVASLLRSAGLVALNATDAEMAGFYAVRLLNDAYTSTMSGEPALTAVRVLAAQNQTLPLYQYVTQEGSRISEVVAECLRNLAGLPVSLLPALLERFGKADDEVVLVGLFDVLIRHRDYASFPGPLKATVKGFLAEFLRTTRRFDAYRYLVTMIMAARKEDLIAVLLEVAAAEDVAAKVEILEAALRLRNRDAAVRPVWEVLQERVGRLAG